MILPHCAARFPLKCLKCKGLKSKGGGHQTATAPSQLQLRCSGSPVPTVTGMAYPLLEVSACPVWMALHTGKLTAADVCHVHPRTWAWAPTLTLTPTPHPQAPHAPPPATPPGWTWAAAPPGDGRGPKQGGPTPTQGHAGGVPDVQRPLGVRHHMADGDGVGAGRTKLQPGHCIQIAPVWIEVAADCLHNA